MVGKKGPWRQKLRKYLKKSKVSQQLELPIERVAEHDRNHHLGGRSFYFFDFDDNVAFLTTTCILFHKKTGQELEVSSAEWAKHHPAVGKCGPYKDYEIRFDEKTGTFRNYRDHATEDLESRGHTAQIFLRDIQQALLGSDLLWKGPAWQTFYHATFNKRPLSVITARGHHPETISQGIQLFVESGFLPHAPNFLSIFPVSHPPTRLALGLADEKASVAELKKAAIRASVDKALQVYGYNPHHRFGMSDDDPQNIQMIHDEMKRLKTVYPELSFFIIETTHEQLVKHEVTHSGLQSQAVLAKDENAVQHLLFEDEK